MTHLTPGDGSTKMIARIDERPDSSARTDVWFTAVLRRPLLVLAMSIAFGVAFGVLAYLTTPTYRGTTILAPAEVEKQGMGSGLSSALGSVSGFAAIAGI